MPRSRLRLRLAGWFALAMVLGLALLDFGLYAALSHRGGAALDETLVTAAAELARAVEREAGETPPPPPAKAANDALEEFPNGPAALLILGPAGQSLAQRGDEGLLATISRIGTLPAPGTTLDVPVDGQGNARLTTAVGPDGATIVAVRSTADLVEALENLRWWLAASIPLVLLVSLPAGYLLARRALRPFGALAAEVRAMRPEALDRRLPVAQPPDELDQVADQVNHLLDRLAASQQQTRQFLRQAAHQLRTPLTLIRGESDLALDRPREADEYRQALDRVRLAARQMSRRVDELFLLARADAGESIARRGPVELDGIVLEAVDLMRARAQVLRRQLTLGTVEGVEIMGDEALLREATLELLENACRHGDAATPVQISVGLDAAAARLTVTSAGPSIPSPSLAGPDATEHLGLAIVRRIAEAHAGQLTLERTPEGNRFSLIIPLELPAGG
jgi:signal transduction histidine kinase